MEEDYADYEMLEELGSKSISMSLSHRASANSNSQGGSFGVVYKARERSTGELVAIKHVRSYTPTLNDTSDFVQRSIWTAPTMTFEIFSKKSPCSAHVPVHTSRDTRPASSVVSSYGLLWNTSAEAHA